jgi:hypothetical protein
LPFSQPPINRTDEAISAPPSFIEWTVMIANLLTPPMALHQIKSPTFLLPFAAIAAKWEEND